MAEGKIIRKGGAVTAQAVAPTITEVSTTNNSITFTITNNDASTAIILWEVDDATPDANGIELAAAATSGNLTATGLTAGTEFIVYATANVTGKVKSNVASLAIETDPPNYTAATGGTTEEYDSGGKRFKSHTFTSNGTFEVTAVGDDEDNRNKVDYLIIAGGGSGGNNVAANRGAGGGGAGGYRTTVGTSGGDSSAESKVTVTATTYSVTIGSGGSGASGANSSVAFPSTITSTGGGKGGITGTTGDRNGSSGGSGGGGGDFAGSGGAGTSGQGRNGGSSDASVSGSGNAGAGGGGAFAVGENAEDPVNFDPEINTDGADGGAGLGNLLRTGSSENRAGGGGGGSHINTGAGSVGGTGGLGGGGNGANGSTNAATAGTANTGSGGGGGANGNSTGANGGGGIVVIRYEIAPSV